MSNNDSAPDDLSAEEDDFIGSNHLVMSRPSVAATILASRLSENEFKRRHLVSQQGFTKSVIKVGGDFTKGEKHEAAVIPPNWKGYIHFKLKQLAHSHTLNFLAAVVVLLDVSMSCLSIDYHGSGNASGNPVPSWVENVAAACFTYYIAELLLHLVARGVAIFIEPMTVIDIIIVTSSMGEYYIESFHLQNVNTLHVLRMVRTLRLVKLLRKVTFFQELQKLIQMAVSSMRTIFWAMTLCFALLTVWAMICVELVDPIVQQVYDAGGFGDCHWCGDSMQSVMRANLTLFQTSIALDGWGDLAIPVIVAQPWTAIVFVGSLVTNVFGILNLIMAVVVDTFAEQRARDVLARAEDMDDDVQKDRTALRILFKRIDPEEKGALSLDELVTAAKTLPEFRSRLRVMDIDTSDLEELFFMLDTTNSGCVECEVFINALSRWLMDSKSATRFVKYNVMRTMNEQIEMRKLLAEQANMQLQFHQKLSAMSAKLGVVPRESEKLSVIVSPSLTTTRISTASALRAAPAGDVFRKCDVIQEEEVIERASDFQLSEEEDEAESIQL